ncbi:MAG: hypothetical protein ACYSUC_02475 [Planctomycetota bacterium]
MKGERYYLLLVTAVAILCVSAVGELAVPHSDEPVLLGRPNPALADLKELYVIVELAGGEPNKDGLVWEELEKLVRDKLTKEAGVTVVEDALDKMESDSLKKLAELLKKRDVAARNVEWRSGDIPELRVDVDMLKLRGSQEYVFHIQATLARPVVLPVQRGVRVKTEVWKLEPVMEAVSVEDMPGKVTETVLRQVETFIACYLVASANYAEPADVNDSDTATKGRAERVKERNTAMSHRRTAGSFTGRDAARQRESRRRISSVTTAGRGRYRRASGRARDVSRSPTQRGDVGWTR